MENDVVCKTVSIDNIRMRMFDGQVRTFTNVRHIPNLKKNLLSLRALEARWHKFSGADSRIKVIKGSMAILEGKQTSNLYKLIKSIINGDAAVIEKEDTKRF